MVYFFCFIFVSFRTEILGDFNKNEIINFFFNYNIVVWKWSWESSEDGDFTPENVILTQLVTLVQVKFAKYIF